LNFQSDSVHLCNPKGNLFEAYKEKERRLLKKENGIESTVITSDYYTIAKMRKPQLIMKFVFFLQFTVCSIFWMFLVPLLSSFSIFNRAEVEQLKITLQTYHKHHNTASRTCLSPERNVSWILDGECEKEQYVSKFNSHRSCGLCGKGATYLQELQREIAAKYRNKQECKELVVYGAALGKSYEKWMANKGYLGLHSESSIERYGPCFIQFVTDYSKGGHNKSADGSQNLVIVDPTKLPYNNHRRNTKIFKFNPGLFFPWADRVIWQDAKNLKSRQFNSPHPRGIPTNYQLHFNRTIERFGTCVSFIALPNHPNTVSPKNATLSLQSHCNAIISASAKRPTVSDSLDFIQSQCEIYQNMHGDHNFNSGNSYQDTLVDSAFIVYDMRSKMCRKFNGDFGCSWLDEIQCYSDRDQISFPQVMASLDIKPSPSPESSPKKTGIEFRDKIFVNEQNIPMVHIAKRSCHFYYTSFSRCLAPPLGEEDADFNLRLKLGKTPPKNRKSRKRNIKNGRVAVIVAGTLQRFMYDSTITHLIKPMTKKKVFVDYYVSLTTAKPKNYRSDFAYTDHFQPDPMLVKDPNPDYSELEEKIRKRIGMIPYASIGAVDIRESIDIDSEPLLMKKRQQAFEEHPTEDCDQSFPILDNRNTEIAKRTSNANRNILKLHFAIQNLWGIAQKWEAEEGFKYDYVMFLRDDTLWLDDFNIDNIHNKKGEIFIPSCDARDPPMDDNELNDHILISRRETADIFGNYYSNLFKISMNACMNQLTKGITKNWSRAKNRVRGCNTEMLLKWVTKKYKVQVKKMSQSELPMQRSGNVRKRDGTNLQCFHKLCQSQKLPLKLEGGKYKHMKKCSNINWKFN